MKESKMKRAKGFRIDPDLEKRLQVVAEKMNLPESWFIKNALEKQMPEFEKMAKSA
jgi:predicted transcriptional regulator